MVVEKMMEMILIYLCNFCLVFDIMNIFLVKCLKEIGRENK